MTANPSPDNQSASPITQNLIFRAVQHVARDVAMGPALYDWLGHGANEVANVLVKGNPAPIYTHSYSPWQSAATVHGPEAPEAAPELTESEPAKSPSIVGQLMEQAAQLQEQRQEMEAER
ncbi:MAG: hypothetical protein KDB14_28340 [Planctomycetales bacterium]|nr:hypothetical protein [Planctomycetales bacterium]